MTTLQIVDNYSNTIADTVQTVAAPTESGIVIESFTATNNSNVNASFKAYIVSAGGVEVPIIPFTVVVWGRINLGVGIVNQVIPLGGELRVESSAIDSIYFTVSGRTVS